MVNVWYPNARQSDNGKNQHGLTNKQINNQIMRETKKERNTHTHQIIYSMIYLPALQY